MVSYSRDIATDLLFETGRVQVEAQRMARVHTKASLEGLTLRHRVELDQTLLAQNLLVSLVV